MKQPGHFNNYIRSFGEILAPVAPGGISSVGYVQNYLAHLLRHKNYYLSIYADVLQKLLQQSSKKKEEIVLIDFGAGNGLLGMFAKHCGFKKVILNDIDNHFIAAARQLAAQLGIEIADFISGDIGRMGAEVPDAVVGTDVIEHVYDLPALLNCFSSINPAMVSVFTTASNPRNYFKVAALKKMQLKDEYGAGVGGSPMLTGPGPAEPFLSIREQIIRKHTNAADEAIGRLARLTRGMHREDIILAVKDYNLYQKYPRPLNHPTNTCDPLTGSWTEKIVSLQEYRQLYKAANFKVLFYNGFYNEFDGGINRHLKKFLNQCIAVFGKRIAPYIVLVGAPEYGHTESFLK